MEQKMIQMNKKELKLLTQQQAEELVKEARMMMVEEIRRVLESSKTVREAAKKCGYLTKQGFYSFLHKWGLFDIIKEERKKGHLTYSGHKMPTERIEQIKKVIKEGREKGLRMIDIANQLGYKTKQGLYLTIKNYNIPLPEKKRMIEVQCTNCGKNIKRLRRRLKTLNFCSRECFEIWWKKIQEQYSRKIDNENNC